MEPSLNEGEALAVLGVRRGAGWDEIEAAHRRLAARAHPDRWLSAAAEDREAARSRFEEVNAAHRVLRSARGVTAPASPPVAPRRRDRTVEPPAPPVPAPRQPASATPAGPVEEVDPTHGPGISKALVGLAVGVLLAVVALAVVGSLSGSPDGGRQRRVLGPLAHRYWEAERTGDYATMWDVLDDDVRTVVDRQAFVAHLERCPPQPAPPPRSVARMTPVGGGRWEVAWEDTAGEPGIGYFRQTADYTFVVEADPDLAAWVRAPIEDAPEQAWCRR